MSILPKIVWPIPANNRGSDFGHQDDILTHLAGESTGLYLIGRNGMWHGGIHITHATTPWCALSGHAASEILDFPGGYRGEQAVRCMVDGEVVAYRICKDYLPLKWETGPLHFSGSFVLVRHYIQLGEKETSGLHFYTLYMHLAPYSAYNINPAETKWTVQCSLSAYEPGWVLMASTNNESLSENYRKGTLPKGAIVEWDKNDGSLQTTAFNNRKYGLVTFVGLTDDAQKVGYSTSVKPGQQYWILVDNNNLVPGTDGVVRPAWWQHLQPPSKEVMEFDQVVCPTPYPISAGDPIGHMGYYQAAKDGGYEARYQVHIECMSMDENLENFLTNPEQFGKNNPLYLKYSPGLTLYRKDVATDTFIQDTRVTTRTGILLLNKIATEVDESTKQEYWQLRPENGYALKGQAEPQLLSQYDLAKLGFRTDMEEPSCFDYLDGKTQPTGFFRNVINALYDASKDDFRVSHALVKYNYQRLLKKIDSAETYYSNMEYWRAFHNPDYRSVVHKTIMKHPSDWYFKKDDAIWLSYLNAQKKEAPEWKAYGEEFLDKMAWMQDVTTEKLGPSLWHMHPIMFLGALNDFNADEMDLKWLTVPKGQLTFDAEGNDVDTNIYFSRKPHIPMQRDGTVIGQSGVTYGRGLDVGQQTQQFVSDLLSTISKNARPLSDKMHSWLIGGSGKKRSLAKEHLALINDLVPINEQSLTRKQQYFLFLSVYADRESTTKRTIEAARGSRHVLAPQGKIIWEKLPTDVQEVLVDLTFRGDNHSKSRDAIIPTLIEGLESSNYSAFKELMNDRAVWVDVFSVPRERFNARSSWVKQSF